MLLHALDEQLTQPTKVGFLRYQLNIPVATICSHLDVRPQRISSYARSDLNLNLELTEKVNKLLNDAAAELESDLVASSLPDNSPAIDWMMSLAIMARELASPAAKAKRTARVKSA